MKKNQFLQIVLAASFATLSLASNANTNIVTATHNNDNTFNTIYGNNFGNGHTYETTFLGDIDATFTANNTTGDAIFNYKPAQGGYQGVGVSPEFSKGRTRGEIDIGESIGATFSSGIFIKNFTLGLVFDGPEYQDVNEKAQISATFADNSVHTYVFTATGPTSGNWTGSGSFTNLSPATLGQGAVWSFTNPFGNDRVKALSFTALTGACGIGACTNQSDYTLVSVSAVPEPDTYAMMLVGLLGIGFMARRKHQA